MVGRVVVGCVAGLLLAACDRSPRRVVDAGAAPVVRAPPAAARGGAADVDAGAVSLEETLTRTPHLRFADRIVVDSRGGYLVVGRGPPDGVRRYLPSGALDRDFLARSVEQAALHGFQTVGPAGALPGGEQLLQSNRGWLAVSPEGRWRKANPSELPGSTALGADPAAPWLRIDGATLQVSAARDGAPVAKVKVTLQPDETLSPFFENGFAADDFFPLTQGATWLLVRRGEAAWRQWSQRVGSDDRAIAIPLGRPPPAAPPRPEAPSAPPPPAGPAEPPPPPPAPGATKRPATAPVTAETGSEPVEPPQPFAAGLVRVVFSRGHLVAERVSLRAQARADVAAFGPAPERDAKGGAAGPVEVTDFGSRSCEVLRGEAGDLVLVFHGQQRTSVYWLEAPGAAVKAVTPVAVLDGPPTRLWLTGQALFGSGTKDATLGFATVGEGRLQAWVTRGGDARVATEAAVDQASAVTFTDAHHLVWYRSGTALGPDETPLGLGAWK